MFHTRKREPYRHSHNQPKPGIILPGMSGMSRSSSFVRLRDRMSNGEQPYCITRVSERLPYVYPIFPSFHTGRREQLCAEVSIFSHTSKVLRASLRLISYIILRLEPRALLTRTAPSTEHVYRTAGVGMYRGIPRVYRLVHTRVVPSLLYPGGT